MIGMIAAAILAAAAQPTAAPALPSPLPYRIIFARTTIEGWRLEAITEVDRADRLPMIRDALCEITRSGLKVTTWGEAGLRARFGDNSVEPELSFEPQRIRRLAFDDSGFEYRQVEDVGSDRFVNVAYPPHPCPYCPTAHAYSVGMRRGAGDPWMSPDLFTDRLLRARTLRIGFEREDENGRVVPPMLWAEVPLVGLDRAIAWCRAALASEGARRFHGGLEEE